MIILLDPNGEMWRARSLAATSLSLEEKKSTLEEIVAKIMFSKGK